MRTCVIAGVIAVCCAPCATARANCAPAARTVVEQYLQLDFAGDRLTAHDAKMRKLTMENGDPPVGPATATKSFRVVSSAPGDNGDCLVRVRFVVYGIVGDRFVFKRHAPRNEDATVSVYCDGDECRINVAPTAFTTPPHAGRAGMLAWLQNMMRVAGNEKAALQSLQKAIEALP